jgi:ABC-type antimicrobial peptide transport system permease subunit
VGVIKDFILTSPYQPTKPMLITGAKGWFQTMLIRLNTKISTTDAISKAETIFKKYNSEYPFDYKFVDDEYASKFEDEKRTAILAALFAGLTIFISCLGLFGLATYMAENRIKEIGIRKVLGASVSSIAALMSKDFIILVIISLLIASPIAWYFMSRFLENYEYRSNINIGVFMGAGIGSIAIALLTVSYQSIRAAIANPVKSLRSE